jgi:nickel transport protein
MFNKLNQSILLLLLLAVLLFSPSAVLAHGVHLDAYVVGNKIIAEASFSDGAAIKNSGINIYDEHGNLLNTSQTDENGRAEFNIPVLEDLKLILNDNLGHQAQYIVKRSKLPAEFQSSNPESKMEAANAVSEEQLRIIVSEELDKKLAPINHDLDQLSNSGPGMTEIIGGIGYIFGLMGLYFYFKKREN